jgi:hypothetical protein
MAPLRGVEPQGRRERVGGLGRRADIPPLLQPSVPGDADAGELRNLLATQAGGAAAKAVRQSDARRSKPLAARTQEFRERSPPRVIRV